MSMSLTEIFVVTETAFASISSSSGMVTEVRVKLPRTSASLRVSVSVLLTLSIMRNCVKERKRKVTHFHRRDAK